MDEIHVFCSDICHIDYFEAESLYVQAAKIVVD